MSEEVLHRLLDERKWELCAALAEDILGRGANLSSQEKAFAAYAKARSLSNLERYSLALEPALISVVLAEEIRDYDLLGHSLRELQFIQSHVPGHELDAIRTLERFLSYEDKYSPPLRQKTTEVLYNLGVAERLAMRHQEAIEHFREAWERNSRTGDVQRAERYRQDYCWEALQTGNLDLALDLIGRGERYLKLHPEEKTVEAHILSDRAWYSYINGEYSQAVSQSMRGVIVAGELGNESLLARCLITWSHACERSGDSEAAMAIGIWAFQEAQKAERPDLISEVRRLMRGLRMDHPDEADRLMNQMVGKA